METEYWHYNTHDIVTRIPELVGQVWALGYGVALKEFECVKAPSNFNGQHSGKGFGPEVFLALSDAGYCLIKEKRYVTF